MNKEFVENYGKMNQLYKQHFEDMQRMNQQWFNLFWRPSWVNSNKSKSKSKKRKKKKIKRKAKKARLMLPL
ncbi:MAG: hypothetical protein ACJ71R_09170, partial [Nitrososphaeraceae archaeon]